MKPLQKSRFASDGPSANRRPRTALHGLARSPWLQLGYIGRQLGVVRWAGDAHALCRLAALARGRGEEVFATPLPRHRADPGKRAVAPDSVVWVDLDGASAEGLREIERLKPHLWVASGAGQHLYSRLRDELEPVAVEELNRRLCDRLGGDPACCEYGRIMRLPGTFNGKRGAWCRIVRADQRRPPWTRRRSARCCPTPSRRGQKGVRADSATGPPGPTTSWP